MNKHIGLYRHFVKDYDSQRLVAASVRCVVLDETDKSYKIKILRGIQRRDPGEELWVRKKSIIRRSYLILGTRFCEMYNMEVTEQNCLACVQNCLAKTM